MCLKIMSFFLNYNIMRILVEKVLVYIMDEEDWEWLFAFKSLLIKVPLYTGVVYMCIQIVVPFLPSLPHYSTKKAEK